MAAGVVTSPATWLLRQVATHTWFQTIQDTANLCYRALMAGTRSAHSLVIDGVGDAVVTATAGTAKVSATASGTSAPTTTVALGELYKDAIPLAWARVTNTGSAALVRGFNISSVLWTAAGVVQVNLVTAATAGTVAVASALGNAYYAQCNSASTSQVIVHTYDAAGVAQNTEFCVLVFGK